MPDKDYDSLSAPPLRRVITTKGTRDVVRNGVRRRWQVDLLECGHRVLGRPGRVKIGSGVGEPIHSRRCSECARATSPLTGSALVEV
jgi:hypothetical protein